MHCGCTFKYEFTLWAYFGIVGYPHIESHSNACMWPTNPLRLTPYLPSLIICIQKLCAFMGLKIPPDCSNCTYFTQIYPYTVVFVPFDTQHTKVLWGYNVTPVGIGVIISAASNVHVYRIKE